jgi:starch-binding outer membrane protein, SusD/RagB family
MKYNILLKIAVVGALFLVSSCDDYLDKMPDNRAEIDSQEKVRKLLVSAYPESDYILLSELSSDNVDDYTDKNPYFDRFLEQVFYWKDVTETDNEDPKSVWTALYKAIGSANMALQAIEDMGNPKELLASKGEALICRAYSHFILVNLFSKHYNKNTSDKDLGIVYMDAPETSLNPKYKRESVAQVYSKIEKDIEAGLPLIDDAGYDVPKYHFNKKAAYAFASRFYLYYEKWDQVISCANAVLTSIPSSMLRDYKALALLESDHNVRANGYVSPDSKSNLLLITAYSNLGSIFGDRRDGSRFSHGTLISEKETAEAAGPWGIYTNSTYWFRPFTYEDSYLSKVLFPKLPHLFEYKDPVAGTGYRRTVYPAFTADEVLLNRAEAYVMQKKYEEAAADLNLWMHNIANERQQDPLFPDDPTKTIPLPVLNIALINSFYSSIAYYTPKAPTLKKKINPAFTVEAGEQENFVQCVLHFRRIATLQEGLRWFDVKRYGIEISRRVVDSNGGVEVKDNLLVNDERRAMQLPQDVISAGLEPNPR